MLDFRKQEYLKGSSTMNYASMCRWIKSRKDSDCWWLKEVNSQSLQQAAKDLDGAYANFFKGEQCFRPFNPSTAHSLSVYQLALGLQETGLLYPNLQKELCFFLIVR